MKRTDLVAGVKHVWALDRADVLTTLAFALLYAGVAVIGGAPVLVTLLVVALVAWSVGSRIYKRARDNREAIAFMAQVEQWDAEFMQKYHDNLDADNAE